VRTGILWRYWTRRGWSLMDSSRPPWVFHALASCLDYCHRHEPLYNLQPILGSLTRKEVSQNGILVRSCESCDLDVST
jgi:hypothetical protein